MRDAQPLHRALAESAVGDLLTRVHRAARVAKLLAEADDAAGKLLPPNFNPLRPGTCELHDRHLVLTVDSTAQAAKLRQALPRIQKHLQRHGLDLNEIRVRVQPAPIAYPEGGSGSLRRQDGSNAHPASGSGSSPLSTAQLAGPMAFATTLAQSLPDSPLKQAAVALQQSLRKRRAP